MMSKEKIAQLFIAAVLIALAARDLYETIEMMENSKEEVHP
jgi:hypothetical protein